MKVCKACGGNVHGESCLLCELFAAGQSYAGVEACRQNRPNASRALKCRAKDRAKAMADARAKGVPTYFADDGTPEFESRGHKKRYLKAYGFVNQDGGYGD